MNPTGLEKWLKTSAKLLNENFMLGQALTSVAQTTSQV
jgi:hypothetical protein